MTSNLSLPERAFIQPLPPRHDERHPALFAAAWAPAELPLQVVQATPTPRPIPMQPVWANVKARPSRLSFGRSRACRKLIDVGFYN